MIQTSIVSAGCYVVPKVLTYLCTRQSLVDGKIGQLKEKMASLQETCAAYLGDRNWFIATEIIGDNAWISAFVTLRLLEMRTAPLNTEIICIAFNWFVCFASISWITRYGLVRAFPHLNRLIGTRSTI